MVKITVLMSVYNGAQTLRSVMDSVRSQTFTDYEFLIFNDGSTDATAEILDDYAAEDSRIRIIHQDNKGLTPSLNAGIELAQGTYIARQDADDLSKPERLAIQLAILEENLDIHLVGSNSEDHYDDLGEVHEWGHFLEEVLAEVVFKRTPFPHSTVMMRTVTVHALGGYNEAYRTTQDAELWMRFAKFGRIFMCPQKLIERHIHSNSISSTKEFRQWRDGFYARRQHAPRGLRTALQVLMRQILFKILPEQILLKLKLVRQNL